MKRKIGSMMGMAAGFIDLGACPFCGGSVSANMAAFQVIHTLPPCAPFLETKGADGFLKAMREEKERQEKTQ